MSNQKSCIVWTRPLCSLCMKVVKILKDKNVQVEERPVDGALWKWEQFKAASPNWSNLPTIQLADGTLLKNIKEVEEWIGRDDTLFAPPPAPWETVQQKI